MSASIAISNGGCYDVNNEEDLSELCDPVVKVNGEGVTIKPEFHHKENVTSVCFSKNGKFLATGSEDCYAQIWYVPTGARILKIKHQKPVSCVSFGETRDVETDGLFQDPEWIATSSWDMRARVFEIKLTGVCDTKNTGEMAYELNVPAELQALPLNVELNSTPAPGENTAEQQGGSQLNTTEASDAQVVPEKTCKMIMKTEKHGDSLMSVCFQPRLVGNDNFVRIATGCRDNVARIFEASTENKWEKVVEMEKWMETEKHDDYVTAVCFSPDGDKLATGSYDKKARIFDCKECSKENCKPVGPVLTSDEHGDLVTSVCFSPCGGYLATGCADRHGRVFAINYTNLEPYCLEILKTTEHSQKITCVGFPAVNPLQTSLIRLGIVATGCLDGRVRFFDIATGKKILESIEPVDPRFVSKPITSLSFSQDCFSRNGSIAIGCKDISKEGSRAEGSAHILKITHWDDDFRAKEIKGKEEEKTECFALFPDGKRVVKVNVNTSALKASIFSVDQNEELKFDFLNIHGVPCTLHAKRILSVSVSLDNDKKWIATGGEDGFVYIFEFDESTKLMRQIFEKCHEKDNKIIPQHSVRFFCDQLSKPPIHLFATSECIRYFDGTRWQKKSDIETDSEQIRSIDFTPDGKSIIAGCEDKCMRMYSVDTGSVIQNIKTYVFQPPTDNFQGAVRSVCCFHSKQTSTDKDFRVATGSEDNHARIFDIRVTPEGVTAKGVKTPKCFRATLIMKTVQFLYGVSSVCFSPDGNLMFAGCWDGKARFFNTSKAIDEVQPIMIFSCDEQNPSVAWSSCHPDINRVAFVSAETNQLQVMPILKNFGADALLPLTESSLLQWARQSEDPQKQCSLFSISHILAREFFTPDTSSSVVALAKKWPHPKYSLFLSTLRRLFENVKNQTNDTSEFVIINAGQILKHLLYPLKPNKLKESRELPEEARLRNVIRHADLAARDTKYNSFICRCIDAAAHGYTPKIQSIKEFLTDLDSLVQSNAIGVRNLELPRSAKARPVSVDEDAAERKKFVDKYCDADAKSVPIIQSINEFWTDLVSLVQSNASVVRMELPETVEALLRNVIQHARFAARDSEFIRQLVAAASIPNIQPTVNEFWTDSVKLVKSNEIVVRDLQAVKFSESTRMYVAGSKSFIEPVWEHFFQENPFSDNGVPLDFDHLFIPFPDIANMCDHEKEDSPSVLKSLVDLNNIDIFGNEVVQALVHFKWQNYAKKLFWVQFGVYLLGLGIVVALSMLTWVQTNDPDDDRVLKIVLAKHILASLLGGLISYSIIREGYQVLYSQPNSHQQQSQLHLSDSISISTSTWRFLGVFWKFRLYPYLTDFWNIIDLANIVFGIWTIVLVWAQRPLTLPVLAVTAYLRWYGTLFYLQAFDNTGPYVRILVEIVWAIRWFLFIMLLSILATWNAFTLLLTRTCKESDAEATCEMPRNVTSAFRTMFDMVNALLFGNGDLETLEHTEYFGLVVFIFIISMIMMPIVLLNMLIAIMGHKYEEIDELSGKEAFRMKAKIILYDAIVQEVELYMKKKDEEKHIQAQPQPQSEVTCCCIDFECSPEWCRNLWKSVKVTISVWFEKLWVSVVELSSARFSHEKWQTMFPKLAHAAGTEVVRLRHCSPSLRGRYLHVIRRSRASSESKQTNRSSLPSHA